MSTIEDFENAPVGAIATHGDGARAIKVDDFELRWVLQNGLYLNDKEMEQWDYTLDPFPVTPTSAREALDLVWELAHPVKAHQVLPEGTACLYRLDDGYQIQETPEGMIARESWLDIRTLEPLLDPDPDWIDAPAVMAHAEDEEPHVWVNVDAQGWRDEHGNTRQWTALRDVDPLYPKGQDA